MHYTGTIWRPPYEAGGSALVQVTAGCTHHKCKFCTLYEDVPFKFRMSSYLRVEADLKEISRYYRNAKRVFFTGANPFVLSFDKLKTLAELVRNITQSAVHRLFRPHHGHHAEDHGAATGAAGAWVQQPYHRRGGG